MVAGWWRSLAKGRLSAGTGLWALVWPNAGANGEMPQWAPLEEDITGPLLRNAAGDDEAMRHRLDALEHRLEAQERRVEALERRPDPPSGGGRP